MSGDFNIQAGTVALQDATLISVGEVAVAAGASLAGTGSVDGQVTIQDGAALTIGLSPGVFAVDRLSLSPTSSVFFELRGLAPSSEFDVLNVSGAANIDGISDISVIGFDPMIGSSFTIINAGSLVGQFDEIVGLQLDSGLELQPVYTSTSLSLVAVPEPSSFALLGLAVLSLAGFISRSRAFHDSL